MAVCVALWPKNFAQGRLNMAQVQSPQVKTLILPANKTILGARAASRVRPVALISGKVVSPSHFTPSCSATWRLLMAGAVKQPKSEHNNITQMLSLSRQYKILLFLSSRVCMLLCLILLKSRLSIMWCDVLGFGVCGGGREHSEQPQRESGFHRDRLVASVGFGFVMVAGKVVRKRVHSVS